jgi:hypothetical protein
MPYWSAEFKPFTPPDIPGLVSWYDSNSTVATDDEIKNILSWRDKYIYRNDLISYLGAINAGNSASNLLPNSGSINVNNTNGDLVFSNAIMTSSRGTLEFQNETRGATIFVYGDFDRPFNTPNNIGENYVSLFTNNYLNPTSYSNNLTVGTIKRGTLFGSNYVNIYDLSNTTANLINLTPNVVGWLDPNRNISNLPTGFVGNWSNLNSAFPNQNLFSGNGSILSPSSNTISVLSNNRWTGPAAVATGCNAANVLNFPFGTYITVDSNRASTTPQLRSSVSNDSTASFIRAVGFVVSYSNTLGPLVNTISATFVPWNPVGGYFRHPFVNHNDQPYMNSTDLAVHSNYSGDGTSGGGVWINSSNVWDPTTPVLVGEGFGRYTTSFDMRSNGLNIVFLRFGVTRKTGIGIAGQGGLQNGVNEVRGFYGQIGDIIVLGSNYTIDDQHTVEGYLAHKYNILHKLRNDHPYKAGYNGIYPFGLQPNSIITGIAFNNSTTVPGFYTTGYFNGRPVLKNPNVNVITTNRANFNMFVGDSSNYTAKDGNIHNINTPIKEIIVYNNPLSEYNIGRVHNYLKEKYSLTPLYSNGNFTY